LLKKIGTDYNGKDGLKTIEDEIKLMETYKNATGDSDKKAKAVKKGGNDAKKIIENWIAEMKERQTSLKAQFPQEKDERNKKTTDDNTPFYKTPLGMTLIIGGVLAVLAVVAYLIKINSSEEEE